MAATHNEDVSSSRPKAVCAGAEAAREVDAVRPMKLPGLQGGIGQHSYSHNSQTQNYLFHHYGKPHLSQALHSVLELLSASFDPTPCHKSNLAVLRVADFGCSHGPNTLDHAHFIVQTVYNYIMLQAAGAANLQQGQNQNLAQAPASVDDGNVRLELHYFFNDLPGNDFNALFRSLQPIGPQLQNLVDAHVAGPHLPAQAAQMRVFAAGVPGSFYGRLFPHDSLLLAVCNVSLNWLSQVPSKVVDRNSEAWNGGHVWIDGRRPTVCEAYAQQFQTDAKAFFQSRLRELVRGGILFIFALSRSEQHPDYYCHYDSDETDFWMGDFDACWQDMVHEGLVSQEERDMFNVPVYYFHLRELEIALEGLHEYGGEIVTMRMLKKCHIMPTTLVQKLASNKEAYGEMWANMIASLVKPMVQAHLGEERAEELFRRLQQRTTKRAGSFTPSTIPQPATDVLIATLRRL